MAWCCQATSHYLRQWWPRWRQQAITWVNDDPDDVCHLMTSLGHNELMYFHYYFLYSWVQFCTVVLDPNLMNHRIFERYVIWFLISHCILYTRNENHFLGQFQHNFQMNNFYSREWFPFLVPKSGILRLLEACPMNDNKNTLRNKCQIFPLISVIEAALKHIHLATKQNQLASAPFQCLLIGMIQYTCIFKKLPLHGPYHYDILTSVNLYKAWTFATFITLDIIFIWVTRPHSLRQTTIMTMDILLMGNDKIK